MGDRLGKPLAVGNRGDDVQPTIAVDIDQGHISVVGFVEEAQPAIVCVGGVLLGAVHQDAVDGMAFGDPFVHEQDVGPPACGGADLLAHHHEVDVAILIDITPGVVFLLDVVSADCWIGNQPGVRLVGKLDPIGVARQARPGPASSRAITTVSG